MVWESCIVHLNCSSNNSFYPGDIVTGSLVFEFKHEQTIEYINFKVKGISKAQWTRPRPTVPYIKNYSEKRKILYFEMNIFEDFNGKRVAPGLHNLQFHFSLPQDLPYTFKSSIAKVYYFIIIEGKVAYKLKQKKVIPIVILGKVNINHLEEYLIPSTMEFQKMFWNKEKFSLCLKMYKGFSPKQIIPFEATIINDNNVSISKLTVRLIQKLEYNVTSGYARKEKKVCKVEYKNFTKKSKEICCFNMKVPDNVMPSTINLRNPMIDISYVFRVEVAFRFHFTLFEDILVILASIPVIRKDL